MRNILLAAAAVLSLSATAYAGEGNGDPFPGPDAAVTSAVGNGITARGQDPFHYAAPTEAARTDGYKYVTKSQDPYQFHVTDRVLMGQAPNTVALAPASNASPSSKAQGLIATQGHQG